ncbi:hypothetical protein GQ42DRAFT_165326 [Ramicandelaber brevisporus]|nr:hypothetical protein GQ42DRAFT_165326 [Ramicandelaber brevisporus]
MKILHGILVLSVLASLTAAVAEPGRKTGQGQGGGRGQGNGNSNGKGAAKWAAARDRMTARNTANNARTNASQSPTAAQRVFAMPELRGMIMNERSRQMRQGMVNGQTNRRQALMNDVRNPVHARAMDQIRNPAWDSRTRELQDHNNGF